MTIEETMFQEVLTAIEQGDRERARDLLTRLLRRNQNNPDYWLWMSTVVETSKERAYCLKEVLRIDPNHVDAQRGLNLMGIMPPDPAQITPLAQQKRNWQADLAKIAAPPPPPVSWKSVALYAGAAVVVIAVILIVIFSVQNIQPTVVRRQPTISFRPVSSATPVTLNTLAPSQTATLPGPTPPWQGLSATYTPTPVYVRTPHPVVEAYSIAIRAYENSDWDKAIQFFEQSLQGDPESADLHYLIGESYRFKGEDSAALAAYNQAIQTNAEFAPAYLGRARIRSLSGEASPDEIRRDLERALELDPNLAEAYLELAQLNLQQEDYDAAQANLDLAGQLLPGSPLIYVYRGEADLALGNFEQAAVNARLALQLDVSLLPAYRLLAESLQANGQYSESLEPLSIYLRYATSQDPTPYLWLGKAEAESGNLEGALAAYSQAIALRRSDLEAYLLRGQIYFQIKNYESALDDFDQAIRLSPKDFTANLLKGQVLLAMNLPGDAYIQFNKCEGPAETDEELAQLYYWRAQSLEPIDAKAAINDWERLLNLPEEAVSQEWRSQAEERITALVTPTATLRPSKTPTPTLTRMPTGTPTKKP